MHWASDAVFYHLFPLGAAGAPARNDFAAAPVGRLDRLHPWLDHAADLGATALLLGPVFESSAHGYDTADYFHVDRRLDAFFSRYADPEYDLWKGGRSKAGIRSGITNPAQ